MPLKVVHIVSRLSRLAGGLFETVPGLTKAVGQLPGMEVSVVGTGDQYVTEDQARWSCKATAVPLAKTLPAKLYYAPGMLKEVLAADAALALCHGLWTHHNWVTLRWAQLTGRPYLVSPHGMVDHVDLRKSRLLKFLARRLYVDRLFCRAACIRAVSDSEAKSLRIFGVKRPICLVPNGIWTPPLNLVPPPAWRSQLPPNAKVLFYLGRLNKKKGLTPFISAWAQVRQREPVLSKNWHVIIAGWDQNGYEQELKYQVAGLGIGACTHFVGPLFGSDKHAAYRIADGFVLPSTSEGLPTVVLEAWAYGVPVLMTPQSNLPEGFSERAALEIQPNVESIFRGLRAFFSMNAPERGAMASQGRKLAESRFSWPRIAREMQRVYQWILGQAPRPETIITE
jgi:poly(glycerol-phosphate) alpha-glucosyltransferase